MTIDLSGLEIVPSNSSPAKRSVTRKGKKNPTKLTFINGTVKYEGSGKFSLVRGGDPDNPIPINSANILDIYCKADVIYSTPDNDKYKAWSIKQRIPHMPTDYHIVYQYWSPLKDGLIVQGFIHDNEFVVTKLKGKKVYDSSSENPENK